MGNMSWVSRFSSVLSIRSLLTKRGNAGDFTGEPQCCVIDVHSTILSIMCGFPEFVCENV